MTATALHSETRILPEPRYDTIDEILGPLRVLSGVRPTVLGLLSELREYIRTRCVPVEREVDNSDVIPEWFVRDMREMEMFGLTTPTEFGGRGFSLVEYALVCREWGRVRVAFHLVTGGHNGLGVHSLMQVGTPEQKRAYLSDLVSGRLNCAFALTEPDVAGSDARGIQCTAFRQSGGWTLKGRKRFITNAAADGLITVVAKAESEKGEPLGITLFLVKGDTEGVEFTRRGTFMGAQGSPTWELTFHDVRLTDADVLGGVGQGLPVAMRTLDKSRIAIGARATGAAERALSYALSYSTERRSMGRSLSEHQGVQWMLADSIVDVDLARRLAFDAAERYDKDGSANLEAAMTKMFCVESANRVVDRSIQILGGIGYSRDLPLEMLYRDLRGQRLWDGSMEMMRVLISNRGTRGPLDRPRNAR
ncbi:MAG TPA: acyl-CoA dehydrogenase family protein [Gammaproteobacteria bacterium]|nr:acyl-CoA dehydrogenase family protein [Gammaproteobacteria bacterium]